MVEGVRASLPDQLRRYVVGQMPDADMNSLAISTAPASPTLTTTRPG